MQKLIFLNFFKKSYEFMQDKKFLHKSEEKNENLERKPVLFSRKTLKT